VLEQRRADCSALVGRREQAESEMEDSRAAIGRLRQDREEVNTRLTGVLAQKQSQEAEIVSRED
jgi:hypothetical protein